MGSKTEALTEAETEDLLDFKRELHGVLNRASLAKAQHQRCTEDEKSDYDTLLTFFVIVLTLALFTTPFALFSIPSLAPIAYWGSFISMTVFFVGNLVLVNRLGTLSPPGVELFRRKDLTARNKALSDGRETATNILNNIPKKVSPQITSAIRQAGKALTLEDLCMHLESATVSLQELLNSLAEAVKPRPSPKDEPTADSSTVLFVGGHNRQDLAWTLSRYSPGTTVTLQNVSPDQLSCLKAGGPFSRHQPGENGCDTVTIRVTPQTISALGQPLGPEESAKYSNVM